MSTKVVLFLLPLAFGLCGCNQGQTAKPQNASPSAVTTTVPYQRFVPVPRQPGNLTGVPRSGAFALDTMTGQLCRTYQRDSPEENTSGKGSTALDTLPLCRALWANPQAATPGDMPPQRVIDAMRNGQYVSNPNGVTYQKVNGKLQLMGNTSFQWVISDGANS